MAAPDGVTAKRTDGGKNFSRKLSLPWTLVFKSVQKHAVK